MKKKSLLRRFVRYYKPHLPMFMLDMSCALMIALIEVAYPLASKYALGTLLPEGMYGAFFAIVAGAAAAYMLKACMSYVVTFLGHQLGVKMEADMRRDIFTHIQSLSFSFYDKSRTGMLLSRCTNDLFDITELAHHGPEDLFISILTFLGAFIVMMTIEWRLALLLLCCIPVIVGFVMLLRRRMSRASRKVKEGVAVINAGIESSISGARVSQAFANEAHEVEKFNGGNKLFVNSKTEYYKTMGAFMFGTDLFTGLLSVIVLGMGGYMIIKKRMDLVALLTFSMYVTSFITPLKKLAQFTETFTMGMSGFARFAEIMDIEPDIKDMPGATPLENVKGEIELKNVSFSYDNKVDVLKNISLSVKPGMKLALVGSSGGGKTTLCQLIPRFYEPTSGSVLIDGRDIRTVTLNSLRRNIGIVQQDVFLFADTIRENIRYGRTSATDDEIIAAAKAAEIHDDIMAMPDGYDTVVGERGVTLSGGQKQRVSIARIFLKNPPILILDEATSALDSATEARITEALDRLSEGRTTLIIAHRLSTIRNADEIIVIEGEGILERGTHDELMAFGGVYKRLNDAQMLK